MAKTGRRRRTAEEQERHGGAYKRLQKIIESDAPDLWEFRRALDEALAGGFPIDFMDDGNGYTLLHEAVFYTAVIRAGLPQVLIEAGADVDARDNSGWTPLGRACWRYVAGGAPEYLAVIDALLALGARHELDAQYTAISWAAPDRRERRCRLEAYIASWPERRARDRAADAAPKFDYA